MYKDAKKIVCVKKGRKLEQIVSIYVRRRKPKYKRQKNEITVSL